ncbi:hypothetical protein SAY86_017032 [Trapa natans]|uniref:Uncharacterized protein n=1 Tax=Trapa natans TaxID=22666 RepID=A0AAN7M0Q1_TRANT|nr:hypothetical protein SAY86_017032 [Trapa natans]
MNTAVDLDSLDLGCVSVSDKQGHDPVLDEKGESPLPSPSATMTTSSASKFGKSKMVKESGQSTNCLSKISSQIRKSSRRKTSPVNWFPRKKMDSYLNRKIKMLQEVDGMNLTLDETLGDANPHYCRVLREKIAAREAAHKAMEARKAALVEVSWCRILRAARIQRKEAESLMEKAEKAAAEAFEAATAMGVIMYDRPNCPRKPSGIEMSSVKGGGFTTHTVTASFETAFEVDREVAAAVKSALVRLANCPSFSQKDEFKGLLHRISQNPEEDDGLEEPLEVSPECESELGSDFKRATHDQAFYTDPNIEPEKSVQRRRQRRSARRQSIEKLTKEKIVDMMFERLKGLQETELSSLATTVATCGLNATLAEVEGNKSNEPGAVIDFSNNPRRMSSCGVRNATNSYLDRFIRRKMESELPSLDKFLVKHETKLERDVREARDHKMESKVEAAIVSKNGERKENSELPCLDKFLVKHMSKLEREVFEAKASKTSADGRIQEEQIGVISDSTRLSETRQTSVREVSLGHSRNLGKNEVPSLDKVLLKHVSRLEREVLEARNRRKTELVSKENINSNVTTNKEVNEDSLEKILIKPVHRLEREKQKALASRSNYLYQNRQKNQGEYGFNESESLDKLLVKHVSRLEREKMGLKQEEFLPKAKRNDQNKHPEEEANNGLDQILVRHKCRLEREKEAASKLEPQEETNHLVLRRQAREKELNEAWGGMSLGNSTRPHLSKLERSLEPQEETNHSVLRRQAREKELNEAWGGMSLGNSMRPHLSKLERDKTAWIKAEEDERRKAALEGM